MAIHKFDTDLAATLLACKAEAEHKVLVATSEFNGAANLAGKLAGIPNGRLLDDCSGVDVPDEDASNEVTE